MSVSNLKKEIKAPELCVMFIIITKQPREAFYYVLRSTRVRRHNEQLKIEYLSKLVTDLYC